MLAWLSVTKVVFSYVSDIIAVAVPVFTYHKGNMEKSQIQVL